jgi:hypothetical protein
VASGVSTPVRNLMLARSQGQCEVRAVCQGAVIGSIHHRQPRGMGGSKASGVHRPTNLLAVCGSGITGCHGHIEANREKSYDLGWLVRRGITPPADEPALLWIPFPGGHRRQRSIYLTDAGGYSPVLP